jgi:hypothetical protein
MPLAIARVTVPQTELHEAERCGNIAEIGWPPFWVPWIYCVARGSAHC